MSAKNSAPAAPMSYDQLSRGRRLQILLAVAIGTFMGPLDSSVVNIALPSIRTYFNTSLGTVEWVIMSYLLIISSLLLSYGRMGDLYGHKKIYLTGFAIFAGGSLLCALSPTVIALIIFRALQAIGAGMLMSMGPAIVTDITPPQERGKSLGIIAISVSVALMTGPILGGILTDIFGWQSVFFINLPIAAIGMLGAWKVIPAIKGRCVEPFDIKGAVLVFLAFICILFPLSYAEKVGWFNYYILGLLAAGVILVAIFLYVESTVGYPMVDMSLFRNRLFSMGNLSALLNYMAQFTLVLIMPFYLQQLRHMSPSQAGLMLIPMPLVTMIIAPISGAVSDKVDSRYISSTGMAIAAVGLALLSTLRAGSAIPTVVLFLIVSGLGVGMFQTPNNSAVMGTVPPNRRGIASSMLATMRNVGMVFGVAISGAVFSSHQNYLTGVLGTRGLTAAAVKVGAFEGAMRLTLWVGAGLALVGVFTSLVKGRTIPAPTAEKCVIDVADKKSS